jgi:hypothetical protein
MTFRSMKPAVPLAQWVICHTKNSRLGLLHRFQIQSDTDCNEIRCKNYKFLCAGY